MYSVISTSSETWPFNFNFVRPVTSRRVASRIFQRVHPAISLRRSSSNEKVTLKVTALQREIAASPLFPVPARRTEKKEKNEQGETKTKKICTLPFSFPCHACHRPNGCR